MKSKISLLLAGIIYVGVVTGIVHAQATVVACVGDSNTFGQNLSRSRAYPAQMEEILQSSDGQWVVHNFGVSGDTVLRQGAQPYSTTRALAVNPDIVIFAFGVNATRNGSRHLIDEHYVSDYVDLISEFSQLSPVPKMWICLPLAAHSTRWSIRPDILENKVVPYIHDVATITGLPIIDLFSVFKEAPELYQGDGIHPTNAGAALMADMVAATILGSLRWPPDFNGDSKVNIEDLVILIERWVQNEPSLDIAPPPFGDGIVDALDLEVVMQYWGHDVNDPTLVAHWALDEAEGAIALDSVSDNGNSDGYALGNPVWQPDGGQVNGAIQLDGVDDFVITSPVMNPADGPLSVLAWIEGGAAGQVVISQTDGVNWLMVDSEGKLMTELTSSGRSAGPLLSQTIITDGDWHRIGFVWDGSNRTLYVDSVAVAQDTQNSLKSSSNGLYIGTGNAMAPGTYFSGLIDDVRIYNRIVIP
ncbi:MAG: hypothetical protein GY774_31520 [Planctomycetes bacterium]|nr:hypothetical protein [Planctomycetota bacterium]